MVKVLVGSKNPVKVASAEEAFSHYFDSVEIEGVAVNSRVADQPMGYDETYTGAENRALALKQKNDAEGLAADFFVGIEGGIASVRGTWMSFGVMCVIDKNGKKGYGLCPHFELPSKLIKRIHEGVEMGLVMDEIQNDQNSKQKHGAISYFTKGVISRKELYLSGMITALIPFLHDDLF